METINPEEMRKSFNMSPKQLLIKKIREYVTNFKATLKLPELIEELNQYKEKSNYYRDAMKGIIPIAELHDEDLAVIPVEHKKYWSELRDLAILNQGVDLFDGIKIGRDQRKVITSIYHDLNAEVLSKINLLERKIESRHEEQSMYDSIGLYDKLINKLELGLALDYNDYDLIKTMIIDPELNTIDENELYIINTFIGEYMLSEHNLVDVTNIPDDDEISEVIEENQTEISDDVLKAIFEKYGYDYDLLIPDKKKLLREFGRVDKINNIFETLKNYKVKKDYMNNLALILVYSSPEIVRSIFDNIASDITKDVPAETLFDYYMSSPNLFISGRKIDKRKNEETGGYHPEGERGLYNNYQANRRFFIEHKVDIASAIKKCISVFGTKNQTLEDTYAKYKSYGISDNLIFEKLSCLSSKDVYEMMDLLIENGCEEHIYTAISQSVKLPRKTIMRIIFAKAKGIDVLRHDGKFNGYITNLHSKELYKKLNIQPADIDAEVAKVIDETEYFNTDALRQEKAIYDNQVEDIIYIRDINTENNKYINYLDNYFMDDNNPNLYIIQGVVISRRKVLRVYGELIKKHDWENNKNLLLYAITYKSILNREQLQTIEQTVDYILQQTKGLK